nr:25S rRNA (uracil2634-N3)-methyltransferase [Ipomoea batatas]
MMQEEVEGLAFAAEEDNVKWIMHYSSHHKILLVGEGDLSFSAALAHAFGSASNIIAISLHEGMHGVDATNMANHPLLQGFIRHTALVRKFLENAVEMIAEDGEIHITHKTDGFHREWDITGLAYQLGLELIKADGFELRDYPGYNTKRGLGGDDNFDCYPSKTYKF